MNVTLLAHTPNPERLVATAARLCYNARKEAEKRYFGEFAYKEGK